MVQLRLNSPKTPASIFENQRITGLSLLKLPQSEYITGQLSGIIDQWIFNCLKAILELDYMSMVTFVYTRMN